MAFVVGCTGGIGSGKSTVAAIFAERHGATVISADDLARLAIQPGSAGHDVVLAHFGAEFARPDGSLDRARLARRVFADPVARAELEAIVHPIVRAGMKARLEALAPTNQVVILDSPLLVEKLDVYREDLDGLLVVDTPEDLALDRLVRLRKMDETDAKARIASQTSRTERIRVADFVIVNMGTLGELAQMVDEAWRWIDHLRRGEPLSPR